MKYQELITTIIVVVIASLIASYLDYLLLEDLRNQKRIKNERMSRYGNF